LARKAKVEVGRGAVIQGATFGDIANVIVKTGAPDLPRPVALTISSAMIDIPSVWPQLPTADLTGVLLIVGAADTGKSTLARYLCDRLAAEGRCVAFLDGDPGQSTLGPPATMTVGEVAAEVPGAFGSARHLRGFLRWFVGATSPRGHMLPLLVGAARLAEAARAAGAETLVCDTSGLVDPAQGGLSLKLAKIDLLRPTAVIAIQREDELEPLLASLRRSQRTRLFELAPSPAVVRRDAITRREHRAAQFGRYFAGAGLREVDCRRLAVFPEPNFAFNQLVALEDAAGFTLGLGIVREANLTGRPVTLLTPLGSLAGVDALRLGDLAVEPWTWRDQRAGA
jgi:polynucleotide 5'-hydroxyl-kinase GRC3/NOL9